MEFYHLSEIKNILKAKLLGKPSTFFANIVIDSRKLTTTSYALFVAISGDRHNGHNYIPDLYKRGIRSFLISNSSFEVSKYPKAGFLLVDDTLQALQKLAAFHRKKFDIPVLAITGSNGKTIVKEWLSQFIASHTTIVRSPKSYNSQIGVPLSVWLLNNKASYGIFEAGISKPGEMSNLEQIIQPTQGIITNIGEAHQLNFQSLRQKINEKIALFKNCDKIFYCSDFIGLEQEILRKYPNKMLCSWSLKDSKALVRFKIENRTPKKCSVQVLGKFDGNRFEIPFGDSASLENCLCIINFLLHNRFPSTDIQQWLTRLTTVAMRLEQIKGVNNCLLINDAYNSDINSLSIALDLLHQQTIGKKSLILSDIPQSGIEDDELYTKVAELLKKANLNKLITIGEKIGGYTQKFSFVKNYSYPSTIEFLQSDMLYNFSNEAILVKGARDFKFERIVNKLSEKNHNTALEIDLDAVVNNLNYYRSLLKPGTGIMVMVKAFSYGSGSSEIANLLQHEQINYMGVAFADEGINLRQAGINTPIIVLSPNKEDFSRMIDYNLEPEIFNPNILYNFSQVAKKKQVSNYPVHVKLDTGMHRLGFQTGDIDDLLLAINENPSIKVASVFSHLAASDSFEHKEFTQTQISLFNKMYNKLVENTGIKPIRHIVNSAGIENFPEAHFEMVRLGIGLHGISHKKSLPFVSRLLTHVSQIKKIPKGETVGYNRKGTVKSEMKIAILPIGYADGLDRRFGNGIGGVIINSANAPYVGDICMDMCMVDVTGIDCKEGDEVIVFGPEQPITLLAKQIKTIPYEILTNVSSRVKRVYVKEQ